GDVDARRTCEHVADESLVSRDVHDAGLDLVIEGEWREAQIDGDASTLLLLPPVGVDAGEGLHERRLPVVDVTGGADDEAAAGAQVGQATPPSATLKHTGSVPSGSMAVPSRTQAPSDGSNPSTPKSSQIPRTPAASIASGDAAASASSAAVKTS